MFDFIRILTMGTFLVFIAATVAFVIGVFALIIFGQIKQARSEKVFAPIASLLGMFILMFGIACFPWIAAWALPETRLGAAIGLTAWLSILFLGAGLMVCEEELTTLQRKWQINNAKRRHPTSK